MRCKRIRLIHVMLAIVPVAALLALLARVGQARRELYTSNCEGHLFYIGAEMVGYRDRYGHFPPARASNETGKPMHSWRTILYAEIDRSFCREYNFAEPWDSPNNIRLADRPPSFFGCPNNHQAPGHYTNYVALVDVERLGPGYIQARGQSAVQGGGLLLVEYPDSHVRWTEPRDLTIDELLSITVGEDNGGIAVLFADRRVRRLSREELARIANGGTK